MKKLLILFVLVILVFGCTGSGKKDKNQNQSDEMQNITDASNASLSQTCIDSDGTDAFTVGFVTAGNKTFTDFCVNSTTLKETLCTGSIAASQSINCPADYECFFGKCTEKKKSSCSDSDGNDIFTAGGVIFNNEANIDTCTGPKNVREYICDGNQIKNLIFECPVKFECNDGKCIGSGIRCTDGDGGFNITQFGKVTIDDNSGFLDVYEDSCNNKELTEYYCLGNVLEHTNTTCPTLTECKNGACIPNTNSTACADSDGLTRELAGSVIKNNLLYTDQCQNEMNVIEYYCQNDEVNSIVLPCTVIPDSKCVAAKCTVE